MRVMSAEGSEHLEILSSRTSGYSSIHSSRGRTATETNTEDEFGRQILKRTRKHEETKERML